MHYCKICDYRTLISTNIKKHYRTKKHINNVQINDNNNVFKCGICNKEYKYSNSLKKHQLRCCSSDVNNSNDKLNDLKNKVENELKKELKKDYEHKLEIEKLKNEYELKIKTIECKNLKQIVAEQKNQIHTINKKIDNLIINNTNNTNNNNTNNIQNINIGGALEFLNTNFCNVLDIDEFIENYKNDYCLTEDETKVLLENSLMGGINNCISTLSFYLQKSAHKMYKDIKGEELSVKESVIPILLVDSSIRSHYEKNDDKWIRTTSSDKLKSIYTITNDQIYKHHQQHLSYDAYQKKKIQNGILKANDYARLKNVKAQDFYKKQPNVNVLNSPNIDNIDNIDNEAITSAINEENDIEQLTEEEILFS